MFMMDQLMDNCNYRIALLLKLYEKMFYAFFMLLNVIFSKNTMAGGGCGQFKNMGVIFFIIFSFGMMRVEQCGTLKKQRKNRHLPPYFILQFDYRLIREFRIIFLVDW